MRTVFVNPGYFGNPKKKATKKRRRHGPTQTITTHQLRLVVPKRRKNPSKKPAARAAPTAPAQPVSLDSFLGLHRAPKTPKKKKRHKQTWHKTNSARIVAYKNAGIGPFVQNPLIMSNPRRRRRAVRRNPLADFNLQSIARRGLTYGSGAGIAVAANALAINKIDNFWFRNGARFGGAVVGAAFLPGELGASAAGAMFYPLMQEMIAKFIPGMGTTAKEADLEALAADLEDVMDELDESDLSDDDEDFEDDVDDILS